MSANSVPYPSGSAVPGTPSTWAWKKLMADLPLTPLFTAAVTGDYLITAYVSVNPDGGGQMGVAPTIRWTDEYGAQVQGFYFAQSNLNYVGQAGGDSVCIHVMAGTTIFISTDADASGNPANTDYEMVVTKTLLGP